MPQAIKFGLLVFPRITQLDMTGPLQFFSSLPNAEVHLIWKNLDPVASDTVLTIAPTTTFADCPQLDVLCVPGGYGVDDLLADDDVLAFLRQQAEGARFVTSVCTGSLLLGAAGLLDGFRAATHWTATEALPKLGATISHQRVCIDRNRITGGGVTAGIDLALTVIAGLVDRDAAEAIQLRLEYNPAPPFNAGSPDSAPADLVARINEKIEPGKRRRMSLVEAAAEKLGLNGRNGPVVRS
jgi:cyclohexyl-isocyanide hydratase